MKVLVHNSEMTRKTRATGILSKTEFLFLSDTVKNLMLKMIDFTVFAKLDLLQSPGRLMVQK